MVLLVDCEDSFTWNLAHALMAYDQDVRVVPAAGLTAEAVASQKPTHLVLSPGPGRPGPSSVPVSLVSAFSGTIPILGVCLGLQSIGASFGAEVVRAKEVVHGSSTLVQHGGTGLFAGLPVPLVAGRYHSLALSREGFPDALTITAWADDGEIMGIRHRAHPTAGVQFHPESILTPDGSRLLKNFLSGSL